MKKNINTFGDGRASERIVKSNKKTSYLKSLNESK